MGKNYHDAVLLFFMKSRMEEEGEIRIYRPTCNLMIFLLFANNLLVSFAIFGYNMRWLSFVFYAF